MFQYIYYEKNGILSQDLISYFSYLGIILCEVTSFIQSFIPNINLPLTKQEIENP